MSQSSDHPMAEHPSAPAPISAPTATNGSTPNAKPRSTIPSSSVPTQPAGAATSTAASAAPPTSTSSSTVAAVLTADDIKYKRKYRDLKKRIREIEEENDQLNLKLTRARKNIRRLRVERSFLFEKLDNVDLPTTNHSLDNASSASSSSGSEDASEDPARRTSVKKKGIQQPPISADSSAAISSRKPKGRPPGRKSTGPSPRRRGATQEKEQHSKNEKEQPLQQQGHDEEEDQLDEEEYETQAAKDTLSLNGNTSMNNDATQDNAMSIDQVTSHSDIDGSHEPAVKEEAMNVDPKELQVDEVMDDTTLPAQTSAQRPQEELNEGQENPRMQALGEPQSVASVARSSIEYKQGQSQSQGESQLSSGQESTTPVQVHPFSPRIGHLQAQPLELPYQQPAWQHYDLPHRQPPDPRPNIQETLPHPPPPSPRRRLAQGSAHESTSIQVILSPTTPTISSPVQQTSPPLQPPIPPHQSEQQSYHQPHQSFHSTQPSISSQASPETFQSYSQWSTHSQLPQHSFENSQEQARRHSYEYAIHLHQKENRWTPPSPSQPHLQSDPEFRRSTQHRQSAPSILQRQPFDSKRARSSSISSQKPLSYPPPPGSPERDKHDLHAFHHNETGYHASALYDARHHAYYQHQQQNEIQQQQKSPEQNIYGQIRSYAGQQLPMHIQEQALDLHGATQQQASTPLSHQNRSRAMLSVTDPSSAHRSFPSTTLPASLSAENSPCTSRASTPIQSPQSPVQLCSPAATPTQSPLSINTSSPSTPGTPQQLMRQLTQQHVPETLNTKRFPLILPRAPPPGSMAPPPPPSISVRKRKSSGPLSAEISPTGLESPTSVSPGSLPTPSDSPSGTSIGRFQRRALPSSPTDTAFNLFSKQHYKLAAAQPGVTTSEHITQALQKMWQQLPEHHKVVYYTAVSQGDHSIAQSLRTPQVGRPSATGQSASSAPSTLPSATMGSDIIDFSSPDSSTDLSLSSSSSSEVKTLRNLKAEFTSGTTTQTVGVKSRTVANTKTDVSENSNSDNNTNEGGGEGEGRPMTQERAAVMTRRHNNAFFQFSMQHRKRLTRELRLPSHRITQILGNMWKQLPESQKLEFEKMAYQEQQKIMTEQNKYFKKHGLGIKNYDTIMFALSSPPSNAPTEAKKSQTRTEKETIQADATAKAVSTTASQQASPTSTGSKESLFRSLTSHPQRPEDKGAYHSVHRPNNKWDRQTQSGKIVFTEPLTLPRSKEKHKTGLGSGGGNRSTSERPVSAASEDATVVFMPAYTTQNRPTMGPPPPLAGPSGRVEGAAATAASAGRKRSPRIIPASGESSTHARLNLAMPSAEGEGHDSADVSEQRYLRDKNVYDRHQHGNELEGEDMYGGSYAPSTPYYSGPCYIPPSPYPLGPSLLNDSGDEDVEEEDYEYHDYAQHDGHEGEESNRGEFVASIA